MVAGPELGVKGRQNVAGSAFNMKIHPPWVWGCQILRNVKEKAEDHQSCKRAEKEMWERPPEKTMCTAWKRKQGG